MQVVFDLGSLVVRGLGTISKFCNTAANLYNAGVQIDAIRQRWDDPNISCVEKIQAIAQLIFATAECVKLTSRGDGKYQCAINVVAGVADAVQTTTKVIAHPNLLTAVEGIKIAGKIFSHVATIGGKIVADDNKGVCNLADNIGQICQCPESFLLVAKKVHDWVWAPPPGAAVQVQAIPNPAVPVEPLPLLQPMAPIQEQAVQAPVEPVQAQAVQVPLEPVLPQPVLNPAVLVPPPPNRNEEVIQEAAVPRREEEVQNLVLGNYICDLINHDSKLHTYMDRIQRRLMKIRQVMNIPPKITDEAVFADCIRLDSKLQKFQNCIVQRSNAIRNGAQPIKIKEAR